MPMCAMACLEKNQWRKENWKEAEREQENRKCVGKEGIRTQSLAKAPPKDPLPVP